MLGDLEDKTILTAIDFESVQNWGSLFVELDIDDGSDDGDNATTGGDLRGRADRSNG
jgi:hypothetical protein